MMLLLSRNLYQLLFTLTFLKIDHAISKMYLNSSSGSEMLLSPYYHLHCILMYGFNIYFIAN